MSQSSKEVRKGFAGLVDLASDITAFDTLYFEEMKASKKHAHETTSQISNKTDNVQRPSKTSQTIQKSMPQRDNDILLSSTTITIENKHNQTKNRKFWVIAVCLAAIFMYWGTLADKKTVPRGRQPIPSSNAGTSQYNQSNIQQERSWLQDIEDEVNNAENSLNQSNSNNDLIFEKPLFGTDNVLSVPQIRWVLREKIRIETMRNLLKTNEAIAEFNKIVDDYNSCAGSFRYREGDLEKAQRDVETIRAQIESEARDFAKNLGRSQATSKRPSTGASVNSAVNFEDLPPNERTQSIAKAQQALQLLGYYKDKVDGKIGKNTRNAIKSFQKDNGLEEDGEITQILIDLLLATISGLEME